METDFQHLDQDLNIDETSLDKEWLKQPQLFMKYSQMAVQLKAEAAAAKEKVKLVDAEIRHEAFSKPQEVLGVAKPTNDRVDAYVTNHDAVVAAKDALVKAEYESNMADAAVFAFHQKKAALEHLVMLLQMEYFGSPKLRGENNKREIFNERISRSGCGCAKKGI